MLLLEHSSQAVRPEDAALRVDLEKKNFNELWALGEQCGIDKAAALEAADHADPKGFLITQITEHFVGELVDSRFCDVWLGEKTVPGAFP